MVVETESDFPWRPSLQLDAEQGTFIFNFDTLSSDLCVGSYTVKNGVLTCKTDDGLYQYLFERTGESTLAFRQE
ncbi:MAG: hypothetical protein Q4C72_08300 [Eubacteriales bacterium]|nr:hypothetical protein [Eubacteriales bacterium]